MEKTVKVLYFVDRMLRGGIQSLVIDWVSRFDKDKIHVDFLLLDDGNEYELEDKLKELGCNVYKLKGIWIRQPFDFIKEAKALDKFFKEHHDYKVVHMHSSSKNYMVLKYAQKYGIPIRIAHSHSVGFMTNNKFKIFVGNIFKKKLIEYSTDFFACSLEAGKWLFGEKIIKTDKFKVIHNGIDINKFIFDNDIRNSIREELKVSNRCILYGDVARFVEIKNHSFLIDIFNSIHQNNSNSKLLLIGNGKLENEIKEKVKKLGLIDNVIFAGFKNNVNEYLFAMDVFIFPSKAEGLGLGLIEAEASDLKCYASKDAVPNFVNISNRVEYIPLSCSASEWAKKILNTDNSKKCIKEDIIKSGYDVSNTIVELADVYLK